MCKMPSCPSPRACSGSVIGTATPNESYGKQDLRSPTCVMWEEVSTRVRTSCSRQVVPDRLDSHCCVIWHQLQRRMESASCNLSPRQRPGQRPFVPHFLLWALPTKRSLL